MCLLSWVPGLVPSLLSMLSTLDALHVLLQGWNFSFTQWEHRNHHTDCTLQHKMLCRYWKEGGKQENQHPFTCLIFSLLFYILLAEISFFLCVLLTAACNLLKNWGFSAQVCISAFGLSAGAIELFSVLLRLSFVFLLHTVSLVFMSLYWYAYSFELLLVFTPLCKHAERINIRFQPLVSLWCSHNTRSLRLTPLQWLQCGRDSQRGKLWDLCLLECKWLYHLIQQQLPILTTLKP